ncbi:MAG: hypothetical protein ACRDT4_27005, partial [Micromonosporaceae bacterium]
MTQIEEVLDRLVREPWFRVRLMSSPWVALAGYDLSESERELLAVELITGPRAERESDKSRWTVPGLSSDS